MKEIALHKYELITSELCPYSQRVVIALEEKGIPYTIAPIDMFSKPDWFALLTPMGNLPVLKSGNLAIFESAVVIEYINESVPNPPLLPEEPFQRARHRMWTSFATALMAVVSTLSKSPDKAVVQQMAGKVKSMLTRLESQLGVGPCFGGEDMSLVDCAMVPPLQRLHWIEGIEPAFDFFAHVPHMTAWWQHLKTRASVVKSAPENMREIFYDFLQGRGTPTRNVPPSWIGARIS